MEYPFKTNLGHALCLCLLILIAIGVYAATIDHSASWDDSLVYLVGAKALAEGHGYRLINIPPPAPTPVYPPLFSAMLSVLWRLAPDYPANLPLLKVVGVLSAVVFAAMAAAILRKAGRPAGLVIAAVGMLLFHTRTIQMVGATVFSDLPFAAVTLLGLYQLERESREPRIGWGMLGLGLAVAASILIRALGVALWVVASGYLSFRRRALAKATLVLVLGGLAVSWFLPWSSAGSTPPKRLWLYGGLSSYYQWYRYTGDATGELRKLSLLEMGVRVVKQEGVHVKFLLQQGLAVGRTGFWFDLLIQRKNSASPIRDWTTILLGLIIASLTLAGALLDWRHHPSVLHGFIAVTYLVAATLPYEPVFLPRYLLPVDIFLNYFFLLAVSQAVLFVRSSLAPLRKGVQEQQWHWLSQTCAYGLAVVLILPNLAFAARHIFNLHAPGGPRGNYYATFNERADAYRWIQEHISPGEVVAAHNAGEVYLITNRHSIPFVADSIHELPDKSVRWILTAPEDFTGVSELLYAEGAMVRWRSDSGRFAIYEFRSSQTPNTAPPGLGVKGQ